MPVKELPRRYSQFICLWLISLSIILSLRATYEIHADMKVLMDYCNKHNCFNKTYYLTLKHTSFFYTFFCLLFLLVNFAIAASVILY